MNVTRHHLFIDGRAEEATSGETFESINPATGEVIAVIDHASADDVDRAVRVAQEAFGSWSQMTGAQRGRILNRAAELLRERNDELARLEVLDTGKPISEASIVDVISGAECIEYYAGVAATLHG
ncbi:MAG: aldehyde dehydrogenase family protein, partial [Acidimicrobiia bacterium]